MEINLTPEQDSFIHLGIQQGRYQSRHEAVQAAMALWERRERARFELIDALEDATRSLDEGGEIELDSDTSVAELIEGVKQRGKARIARV